MRVTPCKPGTIPIPPQGYGGAQRSIYWLGKALIELGHLDMARKYLKYYEQVLVRGSLGEANEPAPATQPGFVAKELLPWED
jgi:hypothetical protein